MFAPERYYVVYILFYEVQRPKGWSTKISITSKFYSERRGKESGNKPWSQ